MVRIEQDINWFANEDKEIEFTIVDTDGEAVDVSGATVIVWVCVRLRSIQENLIVKELASGITVATNVVTVTLTPTDTDQLSGKYRHELRMTDDSLETVLVTGEVEVYKSLTKDL